MESSNDTKLIRAIREQNQQDITKFIEYENMVDMRDKNLFLPIHWCAIMGDIKTAKTLHKKQQNLKDKLNIYSLAPLHLAVSQDNIDFVKWLSSVIEDIDYDEPVLANLTALHLTAKRGSINCFKYLIEQGGNIDAKNSMNLTPLVSAISYHQYEIVDYFIEKDLIDLDDPNTDGLGMSIRTYMSIFPNIKKRYTAFLEGKDSAKSSDKKGKKDKKSKK